MAAISKPAGQNLALAVLTAYLSMLARQPLATKACTTATLNFLQEEIAQRCSGMRADEQRQAKPKSLVERVVNKRVLQFALYGLLISGPLNHFLYEILNKVFAGRAKTKLNMFLTILAQNVVISPILNTVFLAANAVIAGERSVERVAAVVKARLLGMMKVSWVVFPCVQLFAAKALPPLVWVPFFNAVAFTFGTYFNTQGKIRALQAKRAQEKDGKDE
ncbi:hypothetical protein LPJ63_001346 [Coemansia sp. RSA 2711]|nr:hypothetical protein LPJ70_007247 [Coemansia sp. RSA 2708]KAJ1835161.1 hypothetical protein LPJ63_001346 [Coemansia sp. RSA 2711]KAJ2309156.1 hypothetical protein IWW54_003886 [Coemansia sp. RSA 2705]KAJ2317483.1 hypothetical protein IWW52_003100 [Coemansia sp. RSA 2704]KAJ2359910.1 hypothetical protein H4S01_005960 [Coemansia sp. RSA 2610]KAJ2369230.1 hypothetical protein H4S02_009974 [Coemansia sp. RSA 2611]KAJ2732867.1 hypothetical protein H4R23_002742 [Coemansia sp. Cherry 401B]